MNKRNSCTDLDFLISLILIRSIN